MSMPLAVLEDIIDASGIAVRIEPLLPAGVRHRQLRVRTLLTGMMLTLDDRRPAYLTEVHAALTALPGPDQVRLGVIAEQKNGPHLLTYRQAGHAHRLIATALRNQQPDGAPSGQLASICDDLLEASIPARYKHATSALTADRADVESFSRPPRHGTTGRADPEASWGHRNSNLPGPKSEMFYGYYLSAATMTREETGPAVPELARRMTLSSCALDPVRALLPVPVRMAAAGIPLGDIIADSGYAHRDARAWAIPLRHARRPPRPGPPPARPRTPGHPPRRRHRQRQPLLPADTTGPAAARPAATRRRPGRHHRARPAGRRAGKAQARPAHRR